MSVMENSVDNTLEAGAQVASDATPVRSNGRQVSNLSRVSRQTPAETELCEKVLAALARAEAGERGLIEMAHAVGVPLGWMEDAFLALEGDGLVSTIGVPGPLAGISAALTETGRRVATIAWGRAEEEAQHG